jgi:hypothetical protein
MEKKIQLKGCWHNDIDPKVDVSYNGSNVARVLVPKVHMAKKLNTNVKWVLCND